MGNSRKNSGKSSASIYEQETREFVLLVEDLLKAVDIMQAISSRSQSVDWLSTSMKKMFVGNVTTVISIWEEIHTSLGINLEQRRSKSFTRSSKKLPKTISLKKGFGTMRNS